MTQLLMQITPTATAGPCALCGRPTSFSAGLQMIVAESRQPVCPGCGKQHAPCLTALVRLADEAVRVGRIGRHTVFPPYTALLDLARAAEQFAVIASPSEEGG